MAKDYAKQTPIDFDHGHKPSAGRLKKRLLPLLLIVAAIASGYYLYLRVDFQEIEKKAVAKLPLRPKVKTEQATFEFYTRLPEGGEAKSVSTNKNTTKLSVNSSRQTTEAIAERLSRPKALASRAVNKLNSRVAKSRNNKLTQTKKYHLQVGSFRHYKDADRLKAALLLDGFNVSIKSYNNENVTWYRVFVGPYANLKQAKQTQLSLEEAEHNCLIKETA